MKNLIILFLLVSMSSCLKTRDCICTKNRDNEEIIFPIPPGTFSGAKSTCQGKNGTDYRDCHLK